MSSTKAGAVVFVRKKLDENLICEYCVEGYNVTDNFQKTIRIVCLIERQGDHAVFIYSCKALPCKTDLDLHLEQAFPVDRDFRLVTEPPQKDRPPDQTAYILGLQLKDKKFLFELRPDTATEKFIAEIQKAIAIQSQNAGFGLPSSFSWLEPYQAQIFQPAPTPTPAKRQSADQSGPSTDPFGMNSFDPLSYMNLDNGNTATQKTQGNKHGFDDDFANMHIDERDAGRSTFYMRASSSKDSLDMLDRDENSDLVVSMDTVAKRELGLSNDSNVGSSLKPASARETLVEFFVKERQSEFVDMETFRVFVGTWNVNGQNATNLSGWLACDKDPPDLYAIGFQELDLSNQAYIFSDSVREAEWQDAVYKHLHPKAKYQKVKSVRLVGVMLIVYIREKLVDYVSLIDNDQVPTGIMGMLGNKGGVSVRLGIHNTSLCFINSHLAAHQDEVDRRNQDSQDIESKLRFKQFLPPLTVQNHDLVFWLGDLNYRIDMEITQVKECIAHGMLQKLMPHDQLQKQMSTNPVYKKYKEGEINFTPTYRYDPGTDNFDSSEKKRNPAWCDRVLWRGAGVRQIIYRSHPTLKISDHKPVSSLFDIGVKVIDRERYKKVYEDIMKKLDRLENEYLPQVSLAQHEFVFKDVKFDEAQEQVLAIANIGQVPVTYEFINKLDENSYCKPWLSVSPFKAVIVPGDSCEIYLEVCVDKKSAHRFNTGHEKLEDILVLHLDGGKDFFIPISGNYVASSFGSSIEALIQMHGPIRQVATDCLVDLEQPGSLNKVDILNKGTRLYACPKEIWRLVDHLWQYGRHQEDLFQQPGLNKEIHQIRDCVDTGQPEMIPGSIHSVAEALLLFLDSLAEPVIPYSLYEKCLSCSNNFLLCKQVMATVPDCHRNVFKYICAFLRELIEESEHNNLDIKFVASVFSDVFLRAPPNSRDSLTKMQQKQMARSDEMKKAGFLYHFLVHPYDE